MIPCLLFSIVSDEDSRCKNERKEMAQPEGFPVFVCNDESGFRAVADGVNREPGTICYEC